MFFFGLLVEAAKLRKSVAMVGPSAKVFGLCNLAGFGISVATNSHVHLDLVGTGAFTAAALATRGPGLRRTVSTAMVSLWSTRLASFLFYRATQTGRDARVESTLSTTWGAAKFWFISFAWGWLTMLPHTLGRAAALGPGAAAAVALYGLGLVVETRSDLEKYFFKQDPANKGKFCDTGLWALSQHPNYFGNLALWSGIWALNAPTLGPAALVFSTLSPLFVATLLYGQASGSITNAKQVADDKYGANPKYQAYTRDTPLIFPDPLRLAATLFYLPTTPSSSR